MQQQYNVIDADGHVLEPASLWEQYMDPKYQDTCPKVIEIEDGSEVFRLEGDLVIDHRKSGSIKKGTEEEQFRFGVSGAYGLRDKSKEDADASFRLPYAERTRGGYDPKFRIPVMDGEGIDAAFLYPTLGLYLGAERDHDFAAAAMRAYNRWLADYCSEYPERLFGVAGVPMQSAEVAVQELRFAVEELGFRAAFVRPNPQGGRPLHHPDLYPLWEVAQDLDIAIGIHGGSGAVGSQMGLDRFTEGRAVRHVVSHTMEMIAAATSVIMGGIAERFPRLRFGFLESGGGWMIGWLDRMDRHYHDAGMNDTELTVSPSEIFHRQCFISFEPVEKSLVLLGDHLGSDHILWGSDYPHADGFPNAPKMLRDLHLEPRIEQNVLAGGARNFYRLP